MQVAAFEAEIRALEQVHVDEQVARASLAAWCRVAHSRHAPRKALFAGKNPAARARGNKTERLASTRRRRGRRDTQSSRKESHPLFGALHNGSLGGSLRPPRLCVEPELRSRGSTRAPRVAGRALASSPERRCGPQTFGTPSCAPMFPRGRGTMRPGRARSPVGFGVRVEVSRRRLTWSSAPARGRRRSRARLP